MTTRSVMPRIRDPKTLRAYASIFRKDVRIQMPDGSFILRGAPIICWTAAEALDFAADEIEMAHGAGRFGVTPQAWIALLVIAYLIVHRYRDGALKFSRAGRYSGTVGLQCMTPHGK